VGVYSSSQNRELQGEEAQVRGLHPYWKQTPEHRGWHKLCSFPGVRRTAKWSINTTMTHRHYDMVLGNMLKAEAAQVGFCSNTIFEAVYSP